MSHVIDASPTERGVEASEHGLVTGMVTALVVGACVGAAARSSAVTLLIAVAALQALVAWAWILVTRIPGRRGAFVLAAAAAAAADVAVSVWPHSRLGALLGVLGLAVPALFVHQLMRGAARVRVVESLSSGALLVCAEIALSSLVQLRHEFASSTGGRVPEMAVLAIGGAIVASCLVDMIVSTPRFDPSVPRGFPGLVAATAVGAAFGYLVLRHTVGFETGRAAFAGAALGALAGLMEIAGSFIAATAGRSSVELDRSGRALRPILVATLPMAALAPVAFLLCLAIRT
jgi:hypothetical protein